MARRPRMTLADYLVIAISPALVMAMVGSLVFFLIEVFYQGQYEGRLQFVLAMFVVAAVLIGRISIELGAERAAMYAMPLAVATAMAINRFVVTQGGHLGSLGLVGNLALLGLIWWAAHKLVWDCTFIDESRDYTGQGLLQAAGLQKRAPGEPEAEEEIAEPPPDDPLPEHADPQRAADPRSLWRARVQRRPSRAHPPGVWIIYFALAALPVFGFGQAWIPANDAGRRAYGFCLLLTYAASTLGLLLLTSFVGLRRYLRQRWLTMPARMAAAWVATGTILIVGVLTVALFLPRPAPEFSWDDLAGQVARSGTQASRLAVGTQGTDDPRADRPRIVQRQTGGGLAEATSKPPEAPSRPTPARRAQRQPPASSTDEVLPAGRAGTNSGGATSQGHAQGPGARQKKGATPNGPPEAAQAEKNATPPGAPPPAKRPSGSDVPGRFQAENKPVQKPGAAVPSTSAPPSRDGFRSAEASFQPVRAKEQTAALPASRPPLSRPIGRTWPELLAGLIGLLKWVFYAAVAAAVVFWVVRHGREIAAELARLLAELRAWWAGLFKSRAAISGPAAQGPAPPGAELPSLAEYADPFLNGAAERMSPDQLVRYSFEALEAWGREHGSPRQADQTPTEFAQAVGRLEPSLGGRARTLATLYCRAAYAAGTLTPGDVEPLRAFWQQLRSCDTVLIDSAQRPSLA